MMNNNKKIKNMLLSLELFAGFAAAIAVMPQAF